ncbi:MAG TPA: hypothetical protein VLB09_02280, partial [Nitrospiria bacterium]|nr:hypothetical protein [Nitrospiria bacterium]
AMLTNDQTLPYEGEDFEKVLLNLVSALNYAYLGEINEALVEVRKVNHKLGLLNDRYSKKNVYKNDAFAHYLSGILYEANGELNDAFIAYRNSLKAYDDYLKHYGTEMPPSLPSDLLRVTEGLRFDEEHREYQERFPGTTWVPHKENRGKGELIFLTYVGLSPVKEDFFIDAPVPIQGDEVYVLRVALPHYVSRPFDIHTIEVHAIPVKDPAAKDTRLVVSRRPGLVEDVGRIARKNLEDRVGRIQAKAIARAVAKYQMTRLAAVKTGSIGQIGANIFSAVTEKSDTRSWRTLPAEIRLSRVTVEPGLYDVAVEYYDSTQGFIARRTFPGIRLEPGDKKFVFDRIIGR